MRDGKKRVDDVTMPGMLGNRGDGSAMAVAARRGSALHDDLAADLHGAEQRAHRHRLDSDVAATRKRPRVESFGLGRDGSHFYRPRGRTRLSTSDTTAISTTLPINASGVFPVMR